MSTSEPLRIAMIGQRGVPATYGGVERHVEELGARLSAKGHHVTVFCREGYNDTEVRTYRGMRLVPLWAVPSKHLEAISHSAGSSLRTVGAGFDIVHYHSVGPGLMSPVARYLTRAKVVLTVHGLDGERDKWGFVARQMLRAATWMSAVVPDRTIVVGRTLVAHYQKTYRRRVDWVTNGVNRVASLPPGGTLERLGIEPGRYLLFVGRLVPEKAPDLLLRAFAAVEGDVKLVVAGGSSFTEGLQARLRDLAAADPRVVMPGYVYGDDLRELYSNAAAFVLPSDLEGLPLTLLEALSYHLPVVLSDIDPHLEVVGADGPGHRIFPAGDESALAKTLEFVLGDLANERRAAGASAEATLAPYDWDVITDATVDVYRSALGRGPEPTPDRVVVLPEEDHVPSHTGPVPACGVHTGPTTAVRQLAPDAV